MDEKKTASNKELLFPSLENKNILITGGLGFLGSNLAHRCLEYGGNVTLFNKSLNHERNISDIKDKVEIVIGDVRDSKKIDEVVNNKDYIFHFASQISHIVSMENPKLDVDINCNGTLNILESCKKYNPSAIIVFAGTVTQAGVIVNLPASEMQGDFPLSIYEANKLVCEKYLYIYHKVYGLKTVSLRFANIFGERQEVNSPKRGVLNHMIKRAMIGEPITVYGDGKFIRDYNYIQNIVDATLLAVNTDQTNGDYYIVGSGIGKTFKEMVEAVNNTVEKKTGKSTKIVFTPFPEDEKRIDSGDFIADYTKFNEATGWRPRISFEEGLEKTVLFYKDNLKEYLNEY
tara:strand:- start:3666 stop:4700 length:1035 start_codon:yes stop_codon:yes gene_type:complete